MLAREASILEAHRDEAQTALDSQQEEAVKALKALKRGAEEQLQDAATTFGAQLQAAEAELEQAQAKMDGELQAAMQKIAELESGHKKDNLDHQMKRMASDELDLLACTRVAELGGELEAAKERIGELELLLEAKALEVTSVPSPLEKESTTAQQQRARPLSIQVRPAAGVLDDSRGLRRQRRRRSSVVSMQMEGAAQLPQIRAASEPPPVTQAQMQPKAQAPLQVVKLPGSQREREQRIAELATNRIRDLEVALAEAGTREKRIGTLARKRIGQLEAALTDSGLGQLASDAVGLMGKLQDDNRVAELEQTQAAMEGELEAATQQIAELEAARGELGVELEALLGKKDMGTGDGHRIAELEAVRADLAHQLETAHKETAASHAESIYLGQQLQETTTRLEVFQEKEEENRAVNEQKAHAAQAKVDLDQQTSDDLMRKLHKDSPVAELGGELEAAKVRIEELEAARKGLALEVEALRAARMASQLGEERNESSRIAELEALVGELELKTVALEALQNERQQRIGALEASNTELQAVGDERNQQIGELEAAHTELEEVVREGNQKILEASVAERHKMIGDLEPAHAELQALLNSG
jgi:chromosome segregation ATPase